MISPKYLIYHDLIGFKIEVRLKSKPDNAKFLDAGVVIDDTQNMLISEKNGIASSNNVNIIAALKKIAILAEINKRKTMVFSL